MTNATAGVLTQQTCAANCWFARETDCRCSCGGVNHGCLLIEGVEQPRRNCTIRGARYVLGGILGHAEAFNVTRRFVNGLDESQWGRRRKRFDGREYVGTIGVNDKAALVWTKSASDSQQKWPEIARWIDDSAVELYGRIRRTNPTLLWVREDGAETFDQWLASDREGGRIDAAKEQA